MNAELAFMLNLPYQQTLFEPLKDIAVTFKWTHDEGLWVFRYADIKAVEAVLGKKIMVPGIRSQFEKERLNLPRFKGKDFIEIIEYPKIYQIVEHRKMEMHDEAWAEPKIEVKTIKHSIPKNTVDKIWNDVIRHKPLKKPIKTRTIAEQICMSFGVTRFNRESGSFDFAKFFGNRKDYMALFYHPMKVLEHQGKIIHHKNGAVERIK